MKRKTAKEIPADFFQELAAEKSIDKITIIAKGELRLSFCDGRGHPNMVQ